MYFNPSKSRAVGSTLSGGKLVKKTKKCLEQLHRHDPDVVVAERPTKYLFVGNSSVLCSVSLEELQQIFTAFSQNPQFVVYPNRRAYSFVELDDVGKAIRAKEQLNGMVPTELKQSHLPFVIEFVENLPCNQSCDENGGPRDLQIIEDFVDENMERALVQFVESHPRLCHMKHRSVVHYGHAFDYSSNSAFLPTEPIPALFMQLVEKLQKEGLVQWIPDQVTANVYEEGQGIPSHFDTHSAFEDPVVSLSLLSDVVMEFKDAANSARICPVLLKRRSVSLIQGDARYRWKHGIVNRLHDICPGSNRLVRRSKRISLTLRRIRHEPCRCDYKEFCDWDRNGEMSVPVEDESARIMESNYVADVYEEIASHFDETRQSSWKGVKSFLDSLPRGSLLYDVGCGNGKYLIPKDGLIKIGADRCEGLCSIASGKECTVVRGDTMAIPFRPVADALISVAVLHHLSTKERRRKAIQEMAAVLRVGGRGCITVWSMEQRDSEYAKMRENKEDNEEERVEAGLRRLRVHDGRVFTQQDVLVPWTITGKQAKRKEKGERDDKRDTYLRFYHVFAEGELSSLISSIEGLQLESEQLEQGNWIAVFKRIA